MRQAPEPNITVIFKSSLITVLTAKTRSELLWVYLWFIGLVGHGVVKIALGMRLR